MLAERAVGGAAARALVTGGVARQLAEHPHQRMRDRLPLGRRGGLDEPHHCVDRHSLRGVEHESAPLRGIAAHLEQSLQSVRLERADESGDATLQPRRLAGAVGAHLARDLEEVADDHLVVGQLLVVLVDRMGDGFGLECVVIRMRAEVRGDRRAGEADPELRGHAFGGRFGGRCAFVVDELEAVVREREELHVLPARLHQLRLEPDRLRVALRLEPDDAEHVTQLRATQAREELERAEMVAMQLARELGEDGVARLGGHPFDDELAPGDADRERGPVEQEPADAAVDGVDRLVEKGMAGRVDRVLVDRDRQIQQELRELSGEHRLSRRRVRPVAMFGVGAEGKHGGTGESGHRAWRRDSASRRRLHRR